jgi:small subunit ribosomal protein S20
MANTLTTKKNIRVTTRRTAINRSRRQRIKTFLQRVLEAIAREDLSLSQEKFHDFEKEIMKGVSRGVYKKNTAGRKLSGLAKKIRDLAEKKKTSA